MRDEAGDEEDRSAALTHALPWRVIEARALADYRLSVRFADGTRGEVNLSRLVLGSAPGVFAALRDEALFAQVRVEHGAVSWPADLDLAPDAMYEAIRAKGCWIVE
ncbi:MAG: DUF2442 domain-containing protein [Gemmatimonadota bacterium]|nr:DUF2442 domain-containing protein [Gemmatimonadota bacterium]